VPLLAAIAVRAYEFFLLGINRYDRLPPLLEGLSPNPFNMCPDLAKLSSHLRTYPYLAWR